MSKRQLEIIIYWESGDDLYAVGIKATRQPSSRDIRNLTEFSRQMNRQIKMYLFYPGEEYDTIDKVKIIPIAALSRGV